jgi:hypothetical protein
VLIGNGHTGEMYNKVGGGKGKGNYPSGRRRFSEGSCTGGEQQNFIREAKKEIYIRKSWGSNDTNRRVGSSRHQIVNLNLSGGQYPSIMSITLQRQELDT